MPTVISVTGLAKRPYYQQAFAVPFSILILSTSAGKINDGLELCTGDCRRSELVAEAEAGLKSVIIFAEYDLFPQSACIF